MHTAVTSNLTKCATALPVFTMITVSPFRDRGPIVVVDDRASSPFRNPAVVNRLRAFSCEASLDAISRVLPRIRILTCAQGESRDAWSPNGRGGRSVIRKKKRTNYESRNIAERRASLCIFYKSRKNKERTKERQRATPIRVSELCVYTHHRCDFG